MLKTLHVLAGALRLRTFTIKELEKASGVPSGTIHTVLKRIPENWYECASLKSHARGGQQTQYKLTETGVIGIQAKMGKLPAGESLVPTRVEFEEPLGLISARATLERLVTADEKNRPSLRRDILRNLDWAAAQIEDGEFAPLSDKLRVDILRIRGELEEPSKAVAKATPVMPDLPDMSEHLEKLIEESVRRFLLPKKRPGVDHAYRVLIAHKVAERAAHTARRAYEYQVVHAEKSRQMARLAHEHSSLHAIFIAYLGGVAQKAMEMAYIAKGALALESHRRGGHFSIGAPMEARKLLLELRKTHASFQVFICVDDTSDTRDLRKILEKVESAKPTSLRVLDSDHAQNIESLTNQLDGVSYEPRAHAHFGWIDGAVSDDI